MKKEVHILCSIKRDIVKTLRVYHNEIYARRVAEKLASLNKIHNDYETRYMLVPSFISDPSVFIAADKIEETNNKELYYYCGRDRVHKISFVKNNYKDTKQNIMAYLKSQFEYKEGTTQQEKDEHLESWFNCYTTKL